MAATEINNSIRRRKCGTAFALSRRHDKPTILQKRRLLYLTALRESMPGCRQSLSTQRPQ